MNSSIYFSQVAILTQRNKENSGTFEDKHNLSKKLYANIRKQCDEIFYFKFQILNFTAELLRYQCSIALNRNIRKSEIKCLFALIQLHAEYKSVFDLKCVQNLVWSVGTLFDPNNPKNYLLMHKTELFYQWLDIYYDPNEDLNQIIEQFPFELFEYSKLKEFLNDHIADFICFYCIKNHEQPVNISQLNQLLNSWLGTPNKIDRSSKVHAIISSDNQVCNNFYSKFFLSVFTDESNGQNNVRHLLNENLINEDVLKKHFHYIFKQFFTSLNSSFFKDAVNLDGSDTQQSITWAVEMILNILINKHENNKLVSKVSDFL